MSVQKIVGLLQGNEMRRRYIEDSSSELESVSIRPVVDREMMIHIFNLQRKTFLCCMQPTFISSVPVGFQQGSQMRWTRYHPPSVSDVVRLSSVHLAVTTSLNMNFLKGMTAPFRRQS